MEVRKGVCQGFLGKRGSLKGMNAIRRIRGACARDSRSDGVGALCPSVGDGLRENPSAVRWSRKVRPSGAATWRRPPRTWIGPSEFLSYLFAATSAIHAKCAGPIGGYGWPRNDAELMIREKKAERREAGGDLNKSRVGEIIGVVGGWEIRAPGVARGGAVEFPRT